MVWPLKLTIPGRRRAQNLKVYLVSRRYIVVTRPNAYYWTRAGDSFVDRRRERMGLPEQAPTDRRPVRAAKRRRSVISTTDGPARLSALARIWLRE